MCHPLNLGDGEQVIKGCILTLFSVTSPVSAGARVCDPWRVASRTDVETNVRVTPLSTRCGSQNRAPEQCVDAHGQEGRPAYWRCARAASNLWFHWAGISVIFAEFSRFQRRVKNPGFPPGGL